MFKSTKTIGNVKTTSYYDGQAKIIIVEASNKRNIEFHWNQKLINNYEMRFPSSHIANVIQRAALWDLSEKAKLEENFLGEDEHERMYYELSELAKYISKDIR